MVNNQNNPRKAPTKRKPPKDLRSLTASSKVDVQRLPDGCYVINGTHQRDLVNQYPQFKPFRRPTPPDMQPKHLSLQQIAEIVAAMKVT